MRQKLHRQLEKLERTTAAALQARAGRNASSGAEMFRELLSSCATEIPGESLAETVARAADISARELKELLWESAQAIAA
jgi:hypothetical protein